MHFRPLFHNFAKINKKAIIVGASSGIGREVALLLLKEGWHIGVAARREEPLLQLKDAATECVESIHRGRHVRIIDYRYSALTFVWRLIPRWLWRRLKI